MNEIVSALSGSEKNDIENKIPDTMADIDTKPPDSPNSEVDHAEQQSLTPRALEQARQIWSVVSGIVVGIEAVLIVLILSPAVLIGGILRRVLPVAGIVAFILGGLAIAGIWIVPTEFMNPVTQARQVSATGQALLLFGGGGISMIVIGGLIDELFERTAPENS